MRKESWMKSGGSVPLRHQLRKRAERPKRTPSGQRPSSASARSKRALNEEDNDFRQPAAQAGCFALAEYTRHIGEPCVGASQSSPPFSFRDRRGPEYLEEQCILAAASSVGGPDERAPVSARILTVSHERPLKHRLFRTVTRAVTTGTASRRLG